MIIPIFVLTERSTISCHATTTASLSGQSATVPTCLFFGFCLHRSLLFGLFDLLQGRLLDLHDGEAGLGLYVRHQLLGRPHVGGLRLSLLEDGDGSLGLFYHSRDAVQHHFDILPLILLIGSSLVVDVVGSSSSLVRIARNHREVGSGLEQRR